MQVNCKTLEWHEEKNVQNRTFFVHIQPLQIVYNVLLLSDSPAASQKESPSTTCERSRQLATADDAKEHRKNDPSWVDT